MDDSWGECAVVLAGGGGEGVKKMLNPVNRKPL
jgi:hypothetical protein